MSDSRLSDDDRWLAAEHALGLTEGAARAEAQRREEREIEFRRAVEGWHAELEPLLDEVEPVTPPGRVLAALEREIAPPEPRAAPARIAPWRAFALLGMGAALGAVAVGAWLGAAPPAAPGLVATLVASGDGPAAVARIDPRDGELVISISLAPEAETVPEFWLIPAGGTPRSLGTLEGPVEGDAAEIRVPPGALGALVPAPGDTLAISLEPPGGSTTGAPTGPVVASGTLIEI